MKNVTPKLFLVLSMLTLTACGKDEQKNETIDVQSSVDQTQILSNLKDEFAGDPERGKRLYLQCRACHSLKKGEPHKIGPNLYNFYGKQAGSQERFNYSSELLDSKILWDYDNLDRWLENPQALIPENKMVYVGMRNLKDREDLIAYLLIETQ